ncbi:hypothetical protein LTR27_004720 [Elasticomyces elasticus]|nr:hypothetical protein LTR27_004720 [Elasticomyces elasticus]
MRLLNTTTLDFEEFIDTHRVRYSILSHCWSQNKEDPEVSHQAFLSGKFDRNGSGWRKIRRCCRLSKQRGFDWTWIDMCCVDKTSSAELSETTNSMFAWYRDAAECYVFMDDVETISVRQFSVSRWWSRGWTLQELLAPTAVFFFNKDNVFLGTRDSLADLVSHASGIGHEFVTRKRTIYEASIAQRMSWASRRETTRREDEAYALLGIFDVNIPLLYGEGERAFLRLQEEIIRQSDDQTILAWSVPAKRRKTESNKQKKKCLGVLARAPYDFRGSGDVKSIQCSDVRSHAITNQGLALHCHTERLLNTSRFGNWSSAYDAVERQERIQLGCKLGHDSILVLHLVNKGKLWYRTGLVVDQSHRSSNFWHTAVKHGGLLPIIHAAVLARTP